MPKIGMLTLQKLRHPAPVDALVAHVQSSEDRFEPANERPRSRRFSLMLSGCRSSRLFASSSLTSTITPKSEQHRAFLQGALRLSEATTGAEVQVLLSPLLLAWIKEQDAKIIRQAYFDALFLQAKQKCLCADSIALAKEAGLAPPSKDDLISANHIMNNALSLLKDYHAYKMGIVMSTDSFSDRVADFEASTAGGSLTKQYRHYQRAQTFYERLRLCESTAEVSALASSDQATIFALKRLQIACEQAFDF